MTLPATSSTAAGSSTLATTGWDPMRMAIAGLILLDLGYVALSATWSGRRRRT